MIFRRFSLVIAASAALCSATAQAGCLSGALAGGVAGHFLGHGFLGAAGGCYVGHEMAVHKQEDQTAQKFIADYSVSANDPQRQAKDRAAIEKLAQKDHQPLAQKWLAEHPAH